MSDPHPLYGDLCDEGNELDALVTDLTSRQWTCPTPAAGWTVAHQIAHLAWTDEVALLSVTDSEGFTREVEKALVSVETYVDDQAARGALLPAAELLASWREGRSQLVAALRSASPSMKFPWFGPPMSALSVATGRLMETWAHGQDIADALGVTRPATPRLRHVAFLGVRTRDFSFLAHGLDVPSQPFRVELTDPSGELWAFGPEEAEQRVTGPALDFCLLATQRAHRKDVALECHGGDADRWLDLVQAFAGPPGEGRAPRAREATE